MLKIIKQTSNDPHKFNFFIQFQVALKQLFENL
jgi:hypothetical protein